MRYTVKKSNINGIIWAPPSKSHTHREFILAALSSEQSTIINPLLSDDTYATLSAIEALGASVSHDEKYNQINISGGELHSSKSPIDCKNSGTTLRILTSIAAHLKGNTYFMGDASLSRRPMRELLESLSSAGAIITSNNGKLPVTISGPLSKEDIFIPGNISSQFISGLLIAAPLSEINTTVHLQTELTSAPYVEMTINTMNKHGVFVTTTEDGFRVEKGQRYRGTKITVPGDFSSAAILLVAGALCGSVTIRGLDTSDSQGDKEILNILKKFNAVVEENGEYITVKKSNLTAADINLSKSPDLFPIVAVLAAKATGTSHLFGAKQLAFKESNRILTTEEFLKRMGCNIAATDDGCIIVGGKLHGGEITSYDDHRIAMSAVIAGLCAEGETTIDNLSCASISYPNFIQDIKLLGAALEERT